MVIRKFIISQKIWILSLLEKKSRAFIINFCYWKRGISATHLPLCSFVLNFDFWAKHFLLGNGEFTKQPFSCWLNSSCKHAMKQKKKLAEVNGKTLFWIIGSLFLPLKTPIHGFCRLSKDLSLQKLEKHRFSFSLAMNWPVVARCGDCFAKILLNGDAQT